ncbi:hypothetical protein [Acidianus brierleyi]|nr:hypothetical protein [Acidianus brierleyi]AWR95348.2 hypothetical protein DFR85_12830 [Acidianus brierleyi]
MELGVLGSNKLVTTTNAIFTEIFTGIFPDKISILSQDSSNVDFTPLKKALKILGINAEIQNKIVGEEFEKWIEFMEKYSPDILDITPGRKIMALSSIYSKSKEIRYVYLKEEEKGYRIFGWVPFSELKVYNIITKAQLNLKPLKTVNGGRAELDIEGLTSLYNILSLNGKVDIESESDEEIEKLCKMRSGILEFDEENVIRDKIAQGDKITFDTNAFIYLGYRLKKYGSNVIPLRKVYDELEYNSTGSRPDDKTKMFLLGLSSYRFLHNPPPSNVNKGGDEGILSEVKEKMKENGNIWFVTQDRLESEKAKTRGINTILLKNLRPNPDKIKMGSYIHCLSVFSKVRLSIKDEEVITISDGSPSEGHSMVKSVEGFNYAEVIKNIQDFVRSKP